MTSISFATETATLQHLGLVERWTCWSAASGTTCVVGRRAPHEAFAAGRLRVVVARYEDTAVGVSLVASPNEASSVPAWRFGQADVIPASECLLWVGMAIAPSFRKSGLGPVLVHRTLEMAATTGYPFVAAMFPVDDARASTLLARSGFARADVSRTSDPDAQNRSVYLRPTPNLLEDAAAPVAC
jgi:GNAT superfamily N-acetyltransferase